MPNARAYILCASILVGFVLLAVRLGDLMLFDHDLMSEKAKYQRFQNKRLKAGRGGIYDRMGRELAVNMEAQSVYCDPRRVESPDRLARKLSDATGRDYRHILKLVSSDKKFVWIARKLDSERAEAIKAMDLSCVGFVPELKRYYPKGSLASHVIGFVGVDNQPLEGIELQYDAMLKGEEKKVLLIRDAGGRTLSEGVDVEMGASSLILTIDEGLQFIMEQQLAAGIQKWSARAGSAIMMDPYTGEILAMANYPQYDLNRPASSRISDRRNRSLIDPYEPGSTFKMITAAAVLDAGVADFSTMVDASKGYIDVAGMRIWDTKNKGVLSFREVIKKSSNVGAITISQRLRPEELYEKAHDLGFGQRTGIDLPGENPGLLREVSEWSETSQAALSIGYEVAVTPMQMLMAYAAVANGGVLVRPHIVSDVLNPDGISIYRFAAPAAANSGRVLSVSTAAKLRDVLISVTEAGGTATAASVEGNSVAGKTGTTRLIDPETGEYSKERYVSSFVGFVPADKPRLAMIVVVYEPQGRYYGGLVAAPVFRAVADQALAYMNVPRQDGADGNVLLVRGREVVQKR